MAIRAVSYGSGMLARSRTSSRRRHVAGTLVAAGLLLSGCAGLDVSGLTTSTSPTTDAPPPPEALPDATPDAPPEAPPTPPAAPPEPGPGAEVGASSSENPSPHAAAIRAQLEALEIKGRAPKTGYDRGLFGQRWSDDVPVALGRNGCDTRNDILRRDLVDVTVKPGTNGCVALAGTLHDPFTGAVIPFQRGSATSSAVQIDHVVAMSDAWQKGAQTLDDEARRAFANDPLNLLAVDGPSNQRKGDGDAATWLPPNSAFRCQYVARQITVKHRYGLWATPAEHQAMDRWLGTCGPEDDAALAALAEGAVAERR